MWIPRGRVFDLLENVDSPEMRRGKKDELKIGFISWLVCYYQNAIDEETLEAEFKMRIVDGVISINISNHHSKVNLHIFPSVWCSTFSRSDDRWSLLASSTALRASSCDLSWQSLFLTRTIKHSIASVGIHHPSQFRLMDVRISLLTLRLFLASFKRKISIRWDRFMDVYKWLAQLFTYPQSRKKNR